MIPLSAGANFRHDNVQTRTALLQFRGRPCVLGVSLDSNNHVKDRLEAMVEFIGGLRVRPVPILDKKLVTQFMRAVRRAKELPTTQEMQKKLQRLFRFADAFSFSDKFSEQAYALVNDLRDSKKQLSVEKTLSQIGGLVENQVAYELSDNPADPPLLPLAVIDVTDRLHELTLRGANMALNGDRARDQAHAAGDQWIDEHAHILERMATEFGIPNIHVRWAQWERTDKFQLYLKQFETAYEDNSDFKVAVEKDIGAFLARRTKKTGESASTATNGTSSIIRKPSDPVEHQRRCCKEYLLRELAAHSVMLDTLGPCVVFYPGPQQECYKMVRERKVKDVPQSLAQSIFIHLRVYDLQPKPVAGSSPLPSTGEGDNGTGTGEGLNRLIATSSATSSYDFPQSRL